MKSEPRRVPRSFAFFAKGREPRTPAAAKLRRPIAKGNLSPSLIHPYRSGFVEKIETVTGRVARPLVFLSRSGKVGALSSRFVRGRVRCCL
jgi:hypothetical protein